MTGSRFRLQHALKPQTGDQPYPGPKRVEHWPDTSHHFLRDPGENTYLKGNLGNDQQKSATRHKGFAEYRSGKRDPTLKDVNHQDTNPGSDRHPPNITGRDSAPADDRLPHF